MKTKKTITDSTVDPDILRYTVGDDPESAQGFLYG